MTEIPNTEWQHFEEWTQYHICDERCTGRPDVNPIAIPSKVCTCTDDFGAHWKGKKCRVYGCCCMEFVADET